MRCDQRTRIKQREAVWKLPDAQPEALDAELAEQPKRFGLGLDATSCLPHHS